MPSLSELLAMPSEREMFSEILSLVGQPVEVSAGRAGRIVRGSVASVMPDSFIIRSGEENVVLRFSDLFYLRCLRTSGSFPL